MLSDKRLADLPLSDEDLEGIFAPLISVQSILLAVSGGADSMALMYLVHEWAQRRDQDLTIHIASVDHGLRAEATDECRVVGKAAARLGLSHQTLTWHHSGTIDRNLQAQARDARYRLLAEHARSLGCHNIATAHHLNDQAETVLMRLIRGSGVSGLAAMASSSQLVNLHLLRPLLSVPRSRLVASLKARNLVWIEDPSNHSDHFLRVRVRKMLSDLAQEGCDASRLARTASRMARAHEALEAITGDVFVKSFRLQPGRALSVDPKVFACQSEEIRLRLLRTSIDYVAAPDFPPREEGVMALDAAFCEAAASDEALGNGLKRTFAGCCFDLRAARLWIYREPGREIRQVGIDPVGVVNWYNLYDVELFEPLEGVTLRPLGPEGRIALAKEGHIRSPIDEPESAYPVGLIEACPALWQNAIPIAVVDWPEIARKSGVRVDFRGKNPRFTFNQAFG